MSNKYDGIIEPCDVTVNDKLSTTLNSIQSIIERNFQI